MSGSPQRHWRSYGNDPLPTGQEALDEPFRAFPSWFLRIECDRCGKMNMLNEAHTTAGRRNLPIRVLLARMRHDGCDGRPGRAELLTGVEGRVQPPGAADRADQLPDARGRTSGEISASGGARRRTRVSWDGPPPPAGQQCWVDVLSTNSSLHHVAAPAA